MREHHDKHVQLVTECVLRIRHDQQGVGDPTRGEDAVDDEEGFGEFESCRTPCSIAINIVNSVPDALNMDIHV